MDLTRIYLVGIIVALLGGAMVEFWKPIPGYEGLYQVSDQGRVRRIAGGMGARVGAILRPRDNGRGYLFVTLYKNRRPKHRTVHTLVAETFLGPCPEGKEVNHKYGIKYDNRLTEIEYVTPRENVRHSYDVLGHKAARGEACATAKLTAPVVQEIRRAVAKGKVAHRELAKRYGVSCRTIGQIVSRETWAHVA